MPPQNISIQSQQQSQQQHQQHMSQILAEQQHSAIGISMADQHSAHSLDHVHSMADQHSTHSLEHAHSMTDQHSSHSMDHVHSMGDQHSSHSMDHVHSMADQHSSHSMDHVHSMTDQHSSHSMDHVHSMTDQHSSHSLDHVHSMADQHSTHSLDHGHSMGDQRSSHLLDHVHSMPDQHSSHSLDHSHSMADQHTPHSLEHAHAMAEHAAHSMLDLSETGSLEHLAGGGGGHASQSMSDLTSGRIPNQTLDSVTANGGRRHPQHQKRMLSGLNDGNGQSLRQLNNDREMSVHGIGSSNNGNSMVGRPLSGLGGSPLSERQNQPMRNLTPGGVDGRGGQLSGSMSGSMSSDGRGSVGLGNQNLSGGFGNGNSLQESRNSNTQSMVFNSERSSQNMLDSVPIIPRRGRPPTLSSSQHNLGAVDLQHQHRTQSLSSHMRGLSDHAAHSHLIDDHASHSHLIDHQHLGGDTPGIGHNGRNGLSAFGLDNGQLHSRPGSTLLSEPSNHSDARDLSRSVYSTSSASGDRDGGNQPTSLIEETIAAVASNFNKSSPDGGIMPGPLPPNSLTGLNALSLARCSSTMSHLGHGGDDSLADLVGRHHTHSIPLLSERVTHSLSGLMDDHSLNQSPGHSQGRELEKTHPCLTCLKMFRSKQQLAQHSLVHTGIRKHICSFCDRAFKQLSHLQQHVRIHTGVRDYTCKICDRGFKQATHLEKHVRTHIGERKYICSLCEKGFKQLSHLQQHFRIHTDERKYVCSCCEKGFKQLSHLQQHFRIHTGERKYICQICSRAFKQMTHLQQHHRIHTGERKYICQICNRAFKQMTHLQQHHIIHTGERKYVCQVCSRAFKQMTHLQQHHRIHTGERKYVCQICNRAFKQLTHLQKHHVIHTGERKYICQICNHAFRQLTHLQQHHKIHTGERKYVCQCCDRAFKQLTHLQQHYRIHTDERKYVCQCCDRAFRQQSHLNQHFRIHTGEKPYRCKFENCERAFAQLSNLQHHMRNHDDQVKKEATRIHKCQICHRCYTNESSLKSHTLKMHIHIKPIDQHAASIPKKRRKRKSKDLYGGAPTMVPVSSSADGAFSGTLPGMKLSGSRPQSPSSSEEDDEIIFVGEQMGPPRVENFGVSVGSIGGQMQMIPGSGSRGHDLSHQIPFSGMGNFSRGADPLALLASANRFSLQDNMMSGLAGSLNTFSDQLTFRDAALLNSRFGDLRGGSSQSSGFDDRFTPSNFNQQQLQRDRESFGNPSDMSSRGSSGNNGGGAGSSGSDNMQGHNSNSNETRNQIPAHNHGMLRGTGMGGLSAGIGGMMHATGQGGLGGLMKQIKQEPLDYFSSCHGGDQFGGMGVGSGGGFLSPQHLINSHLRGQLPSLNVPLIRDHFSHNQMLPHSSSSTSSGSSSTPGPVIAPSSTPSTSMASTTSSSLTSLPLPLTHMGIYHQSHFSTPQRMTGLHPSPASTPSSQMSVGANLSSNLSSQGGRSPLEQEDLRGFSPLRN